MSAPANKPYGIMAQFNSPGELLTAAKKVRDTGYNRWDVFSPFPIHGIDEVMGLGNSIVGWFALALGVGAFVSVVALIWFCNAYDYPLIVGGKPMFSPPMTFVPAYIMFIMGGAYGALLGMMTMNQLPKFNHPLLKCPNFELVSSDKFILVIGALDPKFSEAETRALLESIGGASIEIVEDEA